MALIDFRILNPKLNLFYENHITIFHKARIKIKVYKWAKLILNCKNTSRDGNYFEFFKSYLFIGVLKNKKENSKILTFEQVMGRKEECKMRGVLSS